MKKALGVMGKMTLFWVPGDVILIRGDLASAWSLAGHLEEPPHTEASKWGLSKRNLERKINFSRRPAGQLAEPPHTEAPKWVSFIRNFNRKMYFSGRPNFKCICAAPFRNKLAPRGDIDTAKLTKLVYPGGWYQRFGIKQRKLKLAYPGGWSESRN